MSVLLPPTSSVLFWLTLTSKPPAVVVILIASAALVPVDERTKDESVAPVTDIVRSSAAAVESNDKLDGAPIASIEIAPPSVVSSVIPPVPASTSIPPAALDAFNIIAFTPGLLASRLIQ